MLLDILELRLEKKRKSGIKFVEKWPKLSVNYLEKYNLEDIKGIYFGRYVICDAIYICF